VFCFCLFREFFHKYEVSISCFPQTLKQKHKNSFHVCEIAWFLHVGEIGSPIVLYTFVYMYPLKKSFSILIFLVFWLNHKSRKFYQYILNIVQNGTFTNVMSETNKECNMILGSLFLQSRWFGSCLNRLNFITSNVSAQLCVLIQLLINF
jgi:hypothetical protein